MGTAPNGYQTPKTNWAGGNIPSASDFNRIEGNIYAVEEGSRTIDPAQTPNSNVGNLRQFLDWFANRIKAITGKTNWYDAPSKTLEDLNTHINAAAPHSGHAPLNHTHSINEITNLFNAFYAGTTTNSGNNYSVTANGITSYTDGLCVVVKINTDSTGAATLNINGLGAKPIKKSNGSDVTNLKANGIYTLRYNATNGNFILQGEGGEGTAQPADVLSGKTFTNDSGTFTGTMPNKVGSGTVITPGTSDIAIPQGYYGGALTDGKVKGDANLVSSNIRSGVSIFGVTGNYFFELKPGENVAYRYPDRIPFTYGTPTRVIEKIVYGTGIIRIKFDLSLYNSGATVYGQIYKNNSPYGTLRSTNSTSDVTFVEDISVTANDRIQLYVWVSNTLYTGSCYNFKICVEAYPIL
ncbi:hypothetical protein Q3V94_08440 [Caloramator sp. CAR-1]|uniref:hypothetical protein n=1 Tax=Caloramator sp. CAR-1 TaxID=3062777 RepID=UPI0026E2617A|nr:hypothetical protein [Caloramator sp. CAR-1]MDO6355105.1 hypothetical protein [Caloramator sp. CAR-1]